MKGKGEKSSSKVIKSDDLENADDADIYSDVLASQDACFEKLQQEVQKLRNEKSLLIKSLDSLQKSYETLQKEFEELESKYTTIAYNSSALFKTAQAEISRKDRTIQGLRKEKDDLLFRRSSSVRTSKRLRRSAIVSPRKLRSPLKKRTSLNHYSRPTLGDSNLHSKQGNENDDIKYDSKEIVQAFPENINDGDQLNQKEEVKVLSGHDKQEEKVESGPHIEVKVLSGHDKQEEKVESGPHITYVPPTIQGPITMYSKRLYKKMHGISPHKIPPPMESLKSNVSSLPNDLKVSPINKRLSIEVAGQMQSASAKEMSSPIDSLKPNIIRANNYLVKEVSPPMVSDKHLTLKVADQECVKQNECKTPSLTSKLKLETQEFIKLGSSLKTCKTSPPQEVIIDLRKLPKENCNSSDRLVREILNTTYALKPDRSSSTDTTTKKTELGDVRICGERDTDITPTKITEVIQNKAKTREVGAPSPNNESNRSKYVILTDSHETLQVNNRSRHRGNNNINKLVIAPVTFGKLVPHEPPKVIAKTVRQSISLVNDQSDESRKRKFNTLSPTGNILPATVQNPTVKPLKSVKKSKFLNSLFGESPLKSDKLKLPILDTKTSSSTLSQIFPNSPSLDSDDSEDLVIDITDCSINASPQLSGSEKKEKVGEEKINVPSQDMLEVNSKISSKSINDNLNPLTNTGNETYQFVKQVLNAQKTFDSKETLTNYGLPDLSECYSLDNDTQPINNPRLINNEYQNIKFDISLSPQKLSTLVQPESKSGNLDVVNCTTEELTTPPRFVPSPPQLSSVSALNHSENSLLNIAGDTLDFVSRLATVRDISPLRTPDKMNNIVTIGMQSPKADLDNSHSGHTAPENSAPNIIALDSIEKMVRINVSNDEGTDEGKNNVLSVDFKNDFEKHVDTASNIDCLMEKPNISEQIKNKQPVLDPDERKSVWPQNEFKRRRLVRRLDSLSKIENKLLTPNSKKENADSKAVKSNLLVDISIKQIWVEKTQEKLQDLPFQTMGCILRNEHNEDPTSKFILKAKDPLVPFLDSFMGITEQTTSGETSLQKQSLNPPLLEEIGTKTEINKSNSEVKLPNIVSKSKEQYHLTPIHESSINSTSKTFDVILKQNEQLNRLKDDVNKLTSEVVHPSIISILKDQEHLTLDNLKSKNGKKSSDLIVQPNKEPPHLHEMNVISNVSKSTSEAMPSKLILKPPSENNLTKFLVQIINEGKEASSDFTSKPNKQLNPNLQSEIKSQNKVNIPTSETVDLSMVNSQKTISVISRENVLSKAKPLVKKLPIKTANIDVEKMSFKPSLSIKTMAKPPGVKYDQSIKSKIATEVVNISSDNGCAEKQAVNTDKELEEMPHIARINQKVRVSTYQGNKEQTVLHMHPSKGNETISPVINNKEISLDRLAKSTVPEPFLKPVVDKNIVRIIGSREISTRNCKKMSRRSVSVDRVFSRRKSQSPTGKQPRSKSNTRGNRDLNKPIPDNPDNKRVLIRSGEISSGNCEKMSRRSVSVDRVFSRRKSQSPTGKQLRRKSNTHGNHDLNKPISEHSDKRVLSRHPSPFTNNKYHRHSRRSQSISPGRRKSFNYNTRQTESKLPVPRNFSQSRNNSQYHETIKNKSNRELSRSSSNSPARTRSKSNHLNRSRESDSPEPKISRRSYHRSRRMYSRSPVGEHRYRSRKRSKSPAHRSHSRHYNERSRSPDHKRYHRYASSRDRSRNEHEMSRSRSPPHLNHKRLPSSQTPDEHEVLQSSGSYRNSKRHFPQSEKYNASETGAEQADKSCNRLSDVYSKSDREEIIALRNELELLKGKLSENVDASRETNFENDEKGNKMKSSDIVCKTDVISRSQSLSYSHHVQKSSKTSDQPEAAQTSGSQTKNYQICVSSSNIHSQNDHIGVNSQQVVNTKENALFTNQKEHLLTPKNGISTRTKHELTTHVQVKRIKRKTRNLGDSDVNVVSATKINDRP